MALPGQLSFDQRTPTVVPEPQSSTDGENETYLKVVTAIVVDDQQIEPHKTLAIFDVEGRSLDDVEWTTAVPNVADRDKDTKVLVNPNTVVLIDERELSSDNQRPNS